MGTHNIGFYEEISKIKQCFLRKTMSPNHLPLSATLKIMVLSSQTLEFVTKDNIYSFGQNKSFSLGI